MLEDRPIIMNGSQLGLCVSEFSGHGVVFGFPIKCLGCSLLQRNACETGRSLLVAAKKVKNFGGSTGCFGNYAARIVDVMVMC